MATQAHTLANKAAHIPDEPPANGAQVFIPSELVLTLEQEQKLMQHVRNELQQMKQEMGRDEFSDDSGISTSPDVLARSGASFFGRRHLSHMVYHQQLAWREHVMGGIYKHTNVHLPLTARILSQQIARANKSFFGTQPYFAVSSTQSSIDEALARDVNAWSRYQLEDVGQLSHHLSSAVELAFVQGETVVKTTQYKLTSFFESFRTIHISPDGQPFVAQDGDYIYQTDSFPPVMETVLDPVTQQPVTDPATQQPLTRQKVDPVTQQPVYALSRDGVTPKPVEPLNFQAVKITLAQTLADKVKARPIYYLDFLCRLKEADIQSAASCAHLYDAPIIELCHRLLNEMFDGKPPEEKLERVAKLASQLLKGAVLSTKNSAAAAADRARPEVGEENQTHNQQYQEPAKELAETWVWYDVFGDGVMRSLMVLTDAEGLAPIYYNYAGNVTHDGNRPFDVLRINPVTNRWYGMGNVEKFWDLQSTADLILNRAFFAQSRAGRIDFVQKDAIVSGDIHSVNWGGTVELAPGKTAADAFTSVYLADNKSDTLRGMLEIILQAAQSMSAVTNVNDGQMAGLDTAKLATGIKNLEQSGEELFLLWIFHLTPGIQGVIQRALGLLLADVNTKKVDLIRFFDSVTSRLIELDPSLLRDISLDVKMELTSYKSQSQLTQAQMGYNMGLAFLQLPNPVIQSRLRPLVNQFLRALEILNVDDITAPITPEEQQQLAALMAPPAPPEGGGIPAVSEPSMNLPA